MPSSGVTFKWIHNVFRQMPPLKSQEPEKIEF